MKTILLFIKVILLLMVAVMPLNGQEINIPLKKTTPVIDGDLSDAVWKDLHWHSDFTLLLKQSLAPVQTRFKCYHDSHYIYFAIDCDEPQMAKLRCKPYKTNAGKQYANDSIEISLVPDAKLMCFYKVVIDSNGTYSDYLGQDDNTDRNNYIFNGLWRSSAKVGVKHHKDKYTVEVAIPFGSMDFIASNNDKWRINVSRNRWCGKREELSSFAPIPKYTHAMPSAFRKATVEKFKNEDYLFDIEAFKGKVLRENDNQHYKMTVMIHNNTPSFRILRMNCVLTDTKTGKIFSTSSRMTVTGRSFRNHSVIAQNIPNGEYILTWDLFSNCAEQFLIKRLILPVKIEYIPLRITLKRPAYRNTIYRTMKDKIIEADIALQEISAKEISVLLEGKNYKKSKKLLCRESINTVIFNGAELQDGEYTLIAEAIQNNKKLTAKARIQVLPYQKGEVFLDTRGVPHVDGKEFLSFGWYAGNAPKQPYYNTILNIAKFSKLPQAVATVKNAFEQYNLRSIVFPFQDLGGYNDWRWVIFKDPDTRKKRLTPLQKQKIREFINGIKDQEGLLGYYMADEPECRDGNPAWYEEAYALIRELDPYHPCFMLNWGTSGVSKYYKACDILIPDCYLQYFEDGSTAKNRWMPSDYAKFTTALRPSWQMPLATAWPDLSRDGKLKGIPPSVFDFRSQVFQAFAHNVKGINYYIWYESQKYTSAVTTPPAIGKLLQEAAPYLLENSLPDGVKVTTVPHDTRFQTGLKIHENKLCLIAVNTSMKNLSVTFNIKTNHTGIIYPEGAKRSIKVINGVFNDTFLPNESILYFTDKTLAEKFIPGRELDAATQKIRQERKKKGNLVAMGEMCSIDYKRFYKKQFIPGMPVITASSESISYVTYRTGSLYFLVDGLIEPARMEFTWTPLPKDKQPFVQFALAKKSKVSKVILYTPYGNLRRGFITVNNKDYPFDNHRKENIITVKLPINIVTDTVRITCRKFEYAGKLGLKSRLLTEVEIY